MGQNSRIDAFLGAFFCNRCNFPTFFKRKDTQCDSCRQKSLLYFTELRSFWHGKLLGKLGTCHYFIGHLGTFLLWSQGTSHQSEIVMLWNDFTPNTCDRSSSTVYTLMLYPVFCKSRASDSYRWDRLVVYVYIYLWSRRQYYTGIILYSLLKSKDSKEEVGEVFRSCVHPAASLFEVERYLGKLEDHISNVLNGEDEQSNLVEPTDMINQTLDEQNTRHLPEKSYP